MLFCKKYSVCDECRVHFEPYRDIEDYQHLCPEHRKPWLDKATRMKFVVSWATTNWERLEKQAREEIQKVQESYNAQGVGGGAYNQTAHPRDLGGFAATELGSMFLIR